ncbi:CIC11C00000004356 [Sungouiella intermedia]|uniref:Iron-sulfur assembly protein 1 n=1 Tax=Sungouiella intermedia TaxID=45354 RepID=A0A1L0CWE7_9ASCO|nr:CIC11C00000004356 [[Candida] intermedia]
MLRYPRLLRTSSNFVRYNSHEGNKRFMQTVPAATKRSPAANFGNLNYKLNTEMNATPDTRSSSPRLAKWAKHSLSFPTDFKKSNPVNDQLNIELPPKPVVRRSRKSRFASEAAKEEKQVAPQAQQETQHNIEQTQAPVRAAELPKVSSEEPVKQKKPRRKLRPRMALITLSPNAVEHLRALLDQPEPQLIRIGVRNRGCSGLTYHLEYVTEPGKFDELVEQDGVKVFIDSKALFSIVGSEMDWIDDKLSSRFIFKNPNSKGTCGCGESFMV